MKVRVVDYVCSPGGGLRFVSELVSAVHALHENWSWELVSHGEALARYAEAFAARPWIAVREAPWIRGPVPVERVAGIPGTGRARKALARILDPSAYPWAVDVPDGIGDGCDACYFPWVHRHRAPAPRAPVVGTFHDATMLQMPGLIAEEHRREEEAVTRRWIESDALLATGSQTTRKAAAELFGVDPGRFQLIPPAYVHPQRSAGASAESLPAAWGWARGKFLICSANTFPHKNHETLIRGFAAWGRRVPLALTGHGTEAIAAGTGDRGRPLKKLARALGLRIGSDLIPLGYVPDAHVEALTRAAWAACMPSLSEGGGSFPAQEALVAGVPVICSDIPVLREQLDATGAPVLWFDPRDPESLAARLRELEASSDAVRERVRAARPALERRTWRDVAAAYAALFSRAVSGPHGTL